MEYTIRNMGNELAGLLADKQEAFLKDFFGSYERAMKLAHLYVFEVGEAKFEAPDPDLLASFDTKYKVTQELRIRPKTHEEFVKEIKQMSEGEDVILSKLAIYRVTGNWEQMNKKEVDGAE